MSDCKTCNSRLVVIILKREEFCLFSLLIVIGPNLSLFICVGGGLGAALECPVEVPSCIYKMSNISIINMFHKIYVKWENN